MLRLLGQAPTGDARALRKQLAPFVNNDPTQRNHHAARFGAAGLETGCLREPTIDDLLRIMGK